MRYQHRVLGMLSLLAAITYLDRVCIAVAGPRMQDALHIRPEAWGWVTSVRFCFGAGEAGAYPNASAVIARWIPAPDARGLGGIVWMTSQVGAALSPLLVVPIQIRYGWRAPFFVFGVVGVVWSVASYAWFRDSPHEKAGVTQAELREIGSAPALQQHGMPWAMALRIPALWRIAGIGACYVYALGCWYCRRSLTSSG